MKIGIFGGSFNPIHKMHEDMAVGILKEFGLDKVIFVPTGDKYNKRDLLDAKKRYHMVSLVCSKYKEFEVSDYEVRNGNRYTYQTLNYFSEIYKDAEIYFIMGADSLVDFENWKKIDVILRNYKLLVVGRCNICLDEVTDKYIEYKNNIMLSNVKTAIVSSTFIRELLRLGNRKEVSCFLDVDVLDYIKKNGLYL